MKWDELTDKQRNKLVHEKVMNAPTVCSGKLQVTHGNGPNGVFFVYFCDICDLTGVCHSENDLPRKHTPEVDIPAYSTDMNAAWQIVEKLYEQFNVEITADLGMLSKYNALVFERDDVKCLGHGYSDTSMPEAVCRAALKAVGIEV